jgi:transcriptional regulator with XRE-family HTH domain
LIRILKNKLLIPEFIIMIFTKIREFRELHNLSEEYVAIQMEITVTEYNKIEKGAVDIKLSKLDRLAKILGIKQSQLFAVN